MTATLAPPWISGQCCPPSCGELTGLQQEPHAVHGSFLQLRHAVPPAEEGTWSCGSMHHHTKRQHYPKELGKRLTERGQYKFQCRGGLCAIAWKDRKPIHFLSNYHDPWRASTVNRRVVTCSVQASTVHNFA